MKLRPDRKRQRGTEEETVLRRLNRATDSVTVSYESDDGRFTAVGYGPTIAARVFAADVQLPPGEWVRVSVSTPAAIYSDLIGRPRDAREGKRNNERGQAIFPAYEGKTVSM